MSVDKQRENREGLTGNRETYNRGEHPNSKANLTPFKEGVSGNPSGRPSKYVNLAKALNRVGKLPPYDWQFEAPDHRTAVLHTIWHRASEGSIQHIRILAELGCLDEDE
jgi:hypothetical protein